MRVALLVVEDEFRMASFLKKRLSAHFNVVDCVTDCAGARVAIRQKAYDLVILDVGLPDGNGIELLRRWRQEGNNEPVLVLSARDGIGDCVHGLDSGADGYLTKPFVFEELVARIQALLRRQEETRQTQLAHRGLKLDMASHSVQFGEQLLELTSREHALLAVFLQNPGRILSRNLICERIWQSQRAADANLLDVYMSRLRTKLQRFSGQSFFRTVRGVGYQLE